MNHLAIIMDGNRRWAQQKGISPLSAHEFGYKTFKKIVEYAFEKQIAIVTVYAFSTENWNRSSTEIQVLLTLFQNSLLKDVSSLCNNNIQVRFIGNIEKFGGHLVKGMRECMELTKNNTGGILQIAVNYGGREELIHAVRGIIQDKVSEQDVTEDLISKYLYTNGIPDPDMIIRTSGEQRLSGFLPWQGVYSELYFLEKYWPDVSEQDIDEILEEFHKRVRRHGT